MERNRLVGVHGDRHGSGYVVAPGLVLTSAHVVGSGPVTVFQPGVPGTVPGTVVWSGTPGGRDDAALVSVPTDVPGSVRWGRAVTDQTGIECETWGLPDAVQTSAAAEAKQVRGHLNAGDRFVGNRYAMTVEGSAWAGMSGAPLFAGHLLLGVISQSHQGQLLAVPSYVLWHNEEFLAALSPDVVRLAPAELEHDSPPVPQPTTSPATFLVAAREIVPWQPRPALMAELQAWLAGDEPVRLIHGPGGQGKTRLALQLGHELPPSWVVWWPHPNADKVAAVTRLRVPTLIVVDYAEARTEQVTALIVAAAANPKVKVLLLARVRGTWWEDLLAADSGITDVLYSTRTHELEPLADGDPYQAALQAFAPHVPGANAAALATRHPEPGHVLTLHMTALADLYDQTGTTSTGTAEDRILIHERHYWRRTAVSHGLANLPSTVLADAVAVVALTGGAADARLSAVPELEGQSPLTMSRIRSWLSSLYPTGSLQPDRLAEGHVAARAQANERLLPALAAVVTPEQAIVMLTVLTRAAVHSDLDTQITDLVRQEPGSLATAAMEVATTTAHPEPLVNALEAVATDARTPLAMLKELSNDLQPSSRCLAEFAYLLVDRLVTEFRSAAAESDDAMGSLGLNLNNLATMLRHRGREADAYRTVLEAVEILVPLAEADPSRYLGHVAMSQNTMAQLLDKLRDGHDRALTLAWEAVRNYQNFISIKPDADRHPLGVFLNTVVNLLNQLGSPAEACAVAQQAVDIYRALLEMDPRRLHGELAMSLRNLSTGLNALGRHPEAAAAMEEAVSIRRRLADARPDTNLADLATELDRLGGALAAAGRLDDAVVAAEEAVGISRQLATGDSAALARCLNNLGVKLADLGRYEEAAAAASEAYGIYVRLLRSRPGMVEDGFALAAMNWSDWLGVLGHFERALTISEVACEVYWKLADHSPRAYRAGFAAAVHNRAHRLLAMSRLEDAVTCLREVVTIRRELMQLNPDLYRSGYELALDHLRQLLEISRG